MDWPSKSSNPERQVYDQPEQSTFPTGRFLNSPWWWESWIVPWCHPWFFWMKEWEQKLKKSFIHERQCQGVPDSRPSAHLPMSLPSSCSSLRFLAATSGSLAHLHHQEELLGCYLSENSWHWKAHFSPWSSPDFQGVILTTLKTRRTTRTGRESVWLWNGRKIQPLSLLLAS